MGYTKIKLKYLILVIAMAYNEILQELRKDRGLSQTACGYIHYYSAYNIKLGKWQK